MRPRRPLGMTVLCAGGIAGLLVGMAGCDGGTPATGSRTVVAADHLEQQRSRLEQIRAGMKTRPEARSSVRR